MNIPCLHCSSIAVMYFAKKHGDKIYCPGCDSNQKIVAMQASWSSPYSSGSYEDEFTFNQELPLEALQDELKDWCDAADFPVTHCVLTSENLTLVCDWAP